MVFFRQQKVSARPLRFLCLDGRSVEFKFLDLLLFFLDSHFIFFLELIVYLIAGKSHIRHMSQLFERRPGRL